MATLARLNPSVGGGHLALLTTLHGSSLLLASTPYISDAVPGGRKNRKKGDVATGLLNFFLLIKLAGGPLKRRRRADGGKLREVRLS